ncbi:MAG: T9SS type A sorting domain-containing protein [Bacteroidetes bacterium]|nr:T9SS type A sorting domain-containing protein [Bacteroidota bacterium]
MTLKKLLLPVCLLLITSGLMAQPGSLDLNFAGDGELQFTFGSDGSYGSKCAIGPDGVIWVSGYSFNTAQQMGLMKILPDGTIDTDFNFDGAIGLNVDGEEASAFSLDVQDDGKVLLCGAAEFGDGDFAVARVLPNGDIDNTFDGDARARVDFGGSEQATCIKQLSDGRILVGGIHNSVGGDVYGALAMLNEDGSMDLNFSGDGRLLLDGGNQSAVFDVEILDDGKIMAAGMYENADFDYGLFRLNPDGTLDNTFGTGGIITYEFGGMEEIIVDFEVQNNGKIIMSGVYDGSAAVLRANADGSIDETFSFDGLTFTEFGTYSPAYSLVPQTDGKTVVTAVGDDVTETYNVFTIMRYNEDGTLDADFGQNGIVRIDVGNDGLDDEAYGLAIQEDGLLVVSGGSETTGEDAFAIVRIISGLNVGLFEQGLDKIQSYVYPNPIASGESLQLDYELKEATEVNISLSDLNGKKVNLLQEYRPSGKTTETINLPTNLSAGIYFLQIRTERGMSTIRVEKF